MAAYTITPDPDETGASIFFPRDSELLAKFKAAFPKARWQRASRCWHVPGVRARTRLEKWATENVPAERPFESERLRDELTTFAPIDSPITRLVGTTIQVRTPYDPSIVAALRAIPGASWDADSKTWRIQLTRAGIDALRAALPAIEARASEAAAAQAAEKAAREAKWTAERAARDQARQAERAAQAEHRSRRILYPRSAMPAFNRPVRVRDAWIVYESTGRDFRIDEDAPSCNGSHLLGHEGEWGCYCYYRPATPEEIEQAEAAQAAARAEREAETARRDALRATWERIRDTDNRAEGTTVYLSQRDREGVIYGYGSSLVVGEEWIWAIMGNGSDGADWSANNLRSAIGWRIPTDAALAARILELGEACGTLVPVNA